MSRPFLLENSRVLKNIEYAQAEGIKLLLDLYLPDKGSGPFPLIVWIHGGGWRTGSKENCRPALLLLPYGYAIASINYRLTGIASFPAQLEDCKAAIRFLRAQAKNRNLEPERIGVWGSSAGGHLSALLGTTGEIREFDRGGYPEFSSRVQAVCDYYGPTYLPEMPGRRFQPGESSPVSALIGGSLENFQEKAIKASPLIYVSSQSAPFFIVHGDRDTTVPVAQSEKLARALEKAGVRVQLQIIKDAGHGGPQFTRPELIRQVASFFDQHLRPESSIK
ncbi:MAG TPA: alpha/beta hydrolase [bacterium]|nr:alpha/beta hydrolase [bacterium]